MPKIIKLSPQGLKRIIAEERRLIREGKGKNKKGKIRDVTKEPKKTKEIDADEYADTLEKRIDHLAAEKVHLTNEQAREERLIVQLKSLRESMRRRNGRIKQMTSLITGRRL